MPLLDALRALASFDPPAALPRCDLGELADVLEAHGLAAMASYHLESRRLGAGLPAGFRERLLAIYQAIVNDNVYRVLTLRGALKALDEGAPGLPVVLLEGAAYLEWLYPHLAFRPVGELRLAVRGEDGAHFAAALADSGALTPAGTGAGGHTATFTNGKLEVRIQEGLVAGSGDDHGLFERATKLPAFGAAAGRPALEDALLVTVGDLAQLGLFAPLIAYVDLRELVRLGPDPGAVKARAEEAGLSRALYGALRLLAHYFPEAAQPAEALRPGLSAPERVAVEAVVDAARDPARLRHLRGAEAAARLAVAPHR